MTLWTHKSKTLHENVEKIIVGVHSVSTTILSSAQTMGPLIFARFL